MPPTTPEREQFKAFTVRPDKPGYMPVLRTQVNVRLAQSLSETPTEGHTFAAIWDTGCTMTAVSPIVVSKLGLKPFHG